MILDVARMDPDGEDFEGEDPVEILDWRPEDDIFYPVAPVRYRFHAKMVGDEVLVTGHVSTRFGGNITAIGSTANLVAISMLGKKYSIKVAFLEWLKVGLVVGVVSCAVATGVVLCYYKTPVS